MPYKRVRKRTFVVGFCFFIVLIVSMLSHCLVVGKLFDGFLGKVFCKNGD